MRFVGISVSLCVSAILSLCVSAATAPTATSRHSPRASASGSSMRIAVIPKGTTHVFWKTVEAGARKAADGARASR